MRILPCLSLALALASALSAQNCIDRNFGTALGVGDDTLFGMQPIGFAFPLNGTTYTNVHVCTNGYMYLSNAGVPAPGPVDFSATSAEFAASSPRIAPFWNDLDIRASNGGQVYINSTPAKCTVTWFHAQNYNTAADGLPVFTIQAQLFPSGQMQFFYGVGTTNKSTSAGGQAAVLGACSGGGATLPSPSDLSVGGATADPTIFEELMTAETFDMANSSLLLVPAAPGWAYTQVPISGCAESQNYGTGCIDSKDSFYEYFSTGANVDLAGKTISMLRSGSGYLVTDALPGSFFTHVSPTIIADADDIEQAVTLSSPMPIAGGTTSSLTVCSNGRIALAAIGNGTAYTPVVSTFLAYAVTTVAPAWHDLDPTLAGSGKILFEEAGGFAYVTWDNVYSHTASSPNLFECQINLATGDITIVYGAALVGSGAGYLAGYSVGGPSPDPTSIDLTTALNPPLQLADLALEGLALTTNGDPFLGNAGFQYLTSKVPALVPLAFQFFGSTQLPGIDLTFLQMPGCRAYSSADLGAFTMSVAGGNGSLAVPIPYSVGLIGAILTAQSLAFSLATPLNLITSNGNQITLGL